MQSTDDGTLLREYSENHSDEAFAALVARHINLVYSVALRRVGDSHQAEEVAQAVFILLAKKAGQLRHDKALSSWLFQATRLTANNLARSETRRHRREQEAHMQSVLSESGSDLWPRIAPLLDDAVAGLSEADRHAIVLRFYEGRNLREVGAALGASEDAAEKRVNRAVEKLRTFFAKRGVTVGASGLVVVISANAVQAAPVGLAVAISATAALAGTTIATAATAAATKAIAMTTLQKTIVTATVAVLAGAGVYESRQVAQLRKQVQELQEIQEIQEEQVPITEQIQRLRQQNNDATQRLAALRSDNERLNRNTTELLRLRAEVTSRLRSYPAQSESRTAGLPAALPPQPAVTVQPGSVSDPQSVRIPEVMIYPENLRELAVKNYGRVTNALANAKSDSDRYFILGEAAKLAFVFGETDASRSYAAEVLALDQRFQGEPWRGGDAVFYGNLSLGRIALQEGKLVDAKQYLLASGGSIGSPALGSFGPNMTLARDLLQAGERETVIQFFDLCRKFWGSTGDASLNQWTQDAQSGRMPDFGANLYF